MTGTVRHQDEIIVRATAREKITLKPGDLFVVLGKQAGRVILKKRRRQRRRARANRPYLTPQALAPARLKRIYGRPDPDWDQLEAEAVASSRRALVGWRLEQL